MIEDGVADRRCKRPLRSLVPLALLTILPGRTLGAIHHPFGSHPFTYAAGAILPNHVSPGVLDQAVRDFYDAWKARYVAQVCGTGRYVVLTKVRTGNLTVSEGHGYGMILSALMAGHDPDARRVFDGMYAYFREHPSLMHAKSNLMAWNQGKSCHDVDGADTASDGDLDIAYALLLADKQWGSCGPIDYLGEALAVIADIKSYELDSTAEYVLLGDWATPGDTQYYPATRTSDFMLDHYRSFLSATGDAAWTGLLNSTYQVIDSVQTGYSPTAGLLPDFVVNPLSGPQPASPYFLEGPNDGAYDYNACRDPWRIATDFLVAGDSRAHSAAQRINTWIRGATGGDPANIKSGYQLNGRMSSGADYQSTAFIAPLGVGAMVDASNQAWLNALWDLIEATPLDAGGYYENTLKLLSMIVMSGNWWAPQAVSGGCAAEGTALCTNGGYVSATQLTLSGLSAPAGNESVKLKGKLFFPQGIPSPAPYTAGAQLLIEDLGAGGAALFDLRCRRRSSN
jgi:endo-1,4-beta-D-glucanase Y